LWSHLARADEPANDLTRRQTRLFDRAVVHARGAGLTPEVVHLANSAALLTDPSTHYDLARAGIALYGVEPILGRRHGLRPAMALRARTLMRRTVQAGAGVSYGHEYVTDHSTTLALIPLGYADGIPRAAGGRAEVLVGGTRRGVAGRVAMDQFVVDLGGDTPPVGEEVLLFGSGERGEPTAEDWGRACGTISYEIITRVGSRVPRRYVGAGDGPGL
jgi:alanine racemase